MALTATITVLTNMSSDGWDLGSVVQRRDDALDRPRT
jgi:hypothetical protein